MVILGIRKPAKLAGTFNLEFSSFARMLPDPACILVSGAMGAATNCRQQSRRDATTGGFAHVPKTVSCLTRHRQGCRTSSAFQGEARTTRRGLLPLPILFAEAQ